MEDFSLHVMDAATTRAEVTPTYSPRDKATILRGDSFNPEGFTNLEILYQIQGGDATLTFRAQDPGDENLYPGQTRDVTEAAFGIDRHWSGRIADIQPDQAAGELVYTATGHGPTCAKTLPMSQSGSTLFTLDWITNLFFGYCHTGSPSYLYGWLGYGYPWMRETQQYVDQSLIATLYRSYLKFASSEDVVRDMLATADYRLGIMAGPDALDGLGCYPYWLPREQNRQDWIITLDDVEKPDDIQISEDWEYYNYLTLEYTDSAGAQQFVYSQDPAAIASKGICRGVFKSTGNGYLDAANAQTISDALLAFYVRVPRAKGTITLPYGDIQHCAGGRFPTVNIRPGEVLILPERGLYEYDYSTAQTTIDQVTGFLAHEVKVVDDQAQVQIQVGEKITELDAMVAQLSVEKQAA